MENSILPEEIIYEILLGVSADSLVHCKLVCRTWRTLVDDPTFIDAHARKANRHLMGFIRCQVLDSEQQKTFHIGEYNDDAQRSTTASFQESKSAIEHCLKGEPVIVGSCNGLICFRAEHSIGGVLDMTVVNPVSGEYVSIPKCRSNIEKRYLIYGFGYNPLTKEYKIVVIFNDRQKYWMDVHVYTLGSGRWRSSSERPGLMVPRISVVSPLRGLFVDGALHWKNLREPTIISFDLAKEELRALPILPPTERLNNRCVLGVLEGCLSMKFRSKQTPTIQDIWVKKEKNDEWVKKFSIADKSMVSPSLNTKYLDYFYPLGVSRCGKLVLEWCCQPSKHQIIVCYDPKTANVECKSFDNTCDIIPYSKSLVSPKAVGLGEEGAVFDKSLQSRNEQQNKVVMSHRIAKERKGKVMITGSSRRDLLSL